MPKRRQKGTDTEKQDSFEEQKPQDKTYTFGAIQVNRYLPPDQLAQDDPNRYSIRSWSNVLLVHKLVPWAERKELFERALKCLPNSYKIWHDYLVEFREYCEERSLFCTDYEELNKKFEEALKYLPKMPRIWLLYAETLSKQNLISKTRQVYNWSFRNLPLPQHDKIWAKFAPWTFTLSNPRTAIQVIGRYLQLNPDFKQNYVDYLRERGQFDLSAKVISDILKDDGYHSKQGKTKYDFLCDLIDLIVQEPSKIKTISGEEVIRKAIEDHPKEASNFWVKLCSYFIRLTEFEKARDSFEKALATIDNAKDFNLIFTTYTKFEEQMLMALKHEGIRKEESVTEQDRIDDQIEERLLKLESLIERRPYMLSNINIKKEPNFVKFWTKLAELHKNAGNMQEYIDTLIKATETIKPEEAESGHFSDVWIMKANYFKEKGDLQKFNQISLRSTQVNYRTVDDYIASWTRWCESLIELGYAQDALEVVKHIILRRKQQPSAELKIRNIEDILKSSVLIWSLYIDLELQIGTFDSARKAYQRCREHKSLNPLMLLNYTNFLWQNAYFEDAFRVFEYAIGEFKWPYVYQIWLSYVNKFVQRYGSTAIGVERTRSIFERLLKDVPKQQCQIFYFIYAEFEQEYGLYSHAIEIYDRLISVVPEDQKYQCYNLYIAKISQMLGVTKTRAVFESALQSLAEDKIVIMALKYADLEKNLNEVERARQIYSYASQFSDPRDDYEGLWKTWEQFQLGEGNKDNYEMYLRVKRSVINKYNMLPPDLKRIEENIKKGII